MSDKYEEREAERMELTRRDVAAREQLAEADERKTAAYERDQQTYAERMREQRHHEVLCLVLKKYVTYTAQEQNDADFVARARRIADLAYPPPSAAEPWLSCAVCGGQTEHKTTCSVLAQPPSPVIYDEKYPQEYAEQKRRAKADEGT